jgi:rod shape-determining protein MreB
MVFNKVPDESILEIQKSGVLLTGGGSKLYGLSDYLSPILGYKVQVVDEPDLSSIIGAGKLVEDKTLLNKLKLKV